MNRELVYHWKGVIFKHFKELYVPQRKRLAVFSLGVLQARHCHQARIAAALAESLGVKPESIERRLRDFTADEKFDLAQFFARWACWVVGLLPKRERVLLLVDETAIGKHYRAMVIGVAFERRCIQLIWRCYKSNSKAAYPAGGQVKMIAEMLAQLKAALPADRQVALLADRGIGNSPKLCRELLALGWDILFRVPKNIKIETEEEIVSPYDKVKPGKGWTGSGEVFTSEGRIPGHIIVRWDKGYANPWILVTNKADLTAEMYGKRNWQEQAFRDWKSSGWQLKSTRIRCAKKLERFLTILALAQGVALMLGSMAIEKGAARGLLHAGTPKARAALSLFNEGLRYWQNEIKSRTKMPRLRLIADGRW